MIDTLIALCIVALFSLWVWNLKHEIESMRSHTGHTIVRLPDSVPVVQAHAAPSHIVPHARTKAHTSSPGTAAAHHNFHSDTESKAGIPTWTIE